MKIEILSAASFAFSTFLNWILLLYSRKKYIASLSTSQLGERADNAEVLSSRMIKSLFLTWPQILLYIFGGLSTVVILFAHGPLKGISVIFILILINNFLVYSYVLFNSIFGVTLLHSGKEFGSVLHSYFLQADVERVLPRPDLRRNAELLACALLNVASALLGTEILSRYNPILAVVLNYVLLMSQNLIVLSCCKSGVLS